MEAYHPMNEEPYEVKLDNHGCRNGPKTGGVRVSTNVRVTNFVKDLYSCSLLLLLLLLHNI